MVTFDSGLSDSSEHSMEDINMAGQSQNIAELLAENDRLRELLNTQQPNQQTSVFGQKRPRPVLPDPEIFNGNQRTLYPQFRAKLKAKLSLDSSALGGASEWLWYAYSRLGGAAATQVLPWINIHTTDVPVTHSTVNDFFAHLDSVFLDKDLQEKALMELNRLHQGNRPFAELLTELRRLIMEAGGDCWSDRVKRGYLDSAISEEIKDRLVAVDKKERFEDYCSQLQQIADRLQERKTGNVRGARRNLPFSNPTTTRSTPLTTERNADPDTMDWEPTLSQARQLRARWVPKEELDKRRKNGECLRCGSKGHLIKQCPFMPAKKPTPEMAKVSAGFLEGAVLDLGGKESEKE